MQKKRFVCFAAVVLFFSGIVSTQAQQSIVSAGGDALGAGGSMSFSTGLPDYYFVETTGAGSLQFGVQHALSFQGDLPAEEELLQNMTILDGENSCFAALATITVAGNGTTFIVQNGGHAELISSGRVIMMEGTKVEHGGYLNARITTNGTFCPEPDKHFLEAPVIAETPIQQDISRNYVLPALEENIFRVYPNPTTGQVTLELTNVSNRNKTTLVEVYGIRGEQVLRQELPADMYQLTLNLTQNPPGIYIIRVLSGNAFGTERIIR